ncbi:MAG: AAA family ATPase [Pelolinea sp.]|jgi:transitional endoplasmic reticulum ATPase|nr:AAA family ATPase [Pelolinea sp.]
MEMIIEEAIELEGTGKVILKTSAGSFQNDHASVLLGYEKNRCGAIVDSIVGGDEVVLVDKYLRLHLKVRPGKTVSVEKKEFPLAKSISVRVPSTWSGSEGEHLLKVFLNERVVSESQQIPVFTLSGSIVNVEVLKTEPAGVVFVGETTAIKIESRSETAPQATGVTYRDIGGLSREIRRIRELVEFPLRSPETFAQLGIEAPRGVILYGPPGTGKTLIAKALSNEVGAKFYSIQGPEIVSALYGESEKHLRDIFNDARANAPAIITIDELDALAPKRDESKGEVERRLVATLLTLMDGLTELKGVVVIGTTNRVNSIDSALRRPGRFEHEIHIGVPDRAGRKQILEIHTRRMPLAEDVDLPYLAEKTVGFVGADMAALCREAGYTALRNAVPEEKLEEGEVSVDGLTITAQDFQTALNVVKPSAMREVMVQVSPNISWDQVGGLEEVKRIIIESIVFGIQKADAYKAAGIRPAKGLLLYGPPGTGKTLLAKAAANQCGANFIAVRGPELRSKWYGESEEKIRFIFAKAREVAPAIIFFDEIDALGAVRGRDVSGISDSLVNQLLTEMDGIETLENVFVIAATNAADLLDPALLRPGRFDLQVYIPLPDAGTREAIFKVHTARIPLDKTVNLPELARAADDFSGADIAEVCRLAALLALREKDFAEKGIVVGMQHFSQAIEDVKSTQKKLKPRSMGFKLSSEER